MKLLISIFIGFLAISTSQQDAVSTPAPNFPDFCSNPNLNKNAKVKACCDAVTEAANAGSYSGAKGPVPDECTLKSCGRVCNRFFHKKGEDRVTEMPESKTTESESPEECECGDSGDETTTGAQPTSRNVYPSGPESSTPGGQVASHKPPAAPSTPQPGCHQPPAAPTTKPPRNLYPSGPEPTPKQPGYPQGPASTPKQPGYPQGPASTPKQPGYPQGRASPTPRNVYPSGPEPSTPGGKVASHKPPAAPSTPQPGYPQPPAAPTKPPRNLYPSGPEPTPKQPGYPQGPASPTPPSHKQPKQPSPTPPSSAPSPPGLPPSVTAPPSGQYPPGSNVTSNSLTVPPLYTTNETCLPLTPDMPGVVDQWLNKPKTGRFPYHACVGSDLWSPVKKWVRSCLTDIPNHYIRNDQVCVNKCVKIEYKNKTLIMPIMDETDYLKPYELDISEPAFKYLEMNPNAGWCTATVTYIRCEKLGN
uniref:Putative avirulence protein n=1 Tax=Meloidogyne javanica TaxID=6303 RepID=A0A915LQR2_MELJA